MHLEDEQIQRLLHGEVDAAAKAALSGHLAECTACRQSLAAAELEETRIFDLLRSIDVAPPTLRAESLMQRTGGGLLARRRRVAGLVLAFAAAGAAAFAWPGSPVPAWMDRVAQRVVHAVPKSNPAAPAAPAPLAAGGIAVVPTDRFVIRFGAAQAEGVVRVSLAEGRKIVARVVNGSARFRSDPERLLIDNPGSTASYEIELPQDAQRVEIQVGDDRLLLKEGPDVLTDSPIDAQGRYVLSLKKPSP